MERFRSNEHLTFLGETGITPMITKLLTTLIPHYQPIVSLHDRSIVSYECLARFITEDGKIMSPDDLLDLFADRHFLNDLFYKSFFATISEELHVPIAFNLVVLIINPGLINVLENIALCHPHLVHYLHFEITEHNIVRGMGTLPAYVNTLRGLGYKVILDDFGTGGASIECLERIRFDIIKIDGQFLKNAVNSTGRARLKAIVKLLKNEKVELVAEHIETEQIARFAQEIGIEYGQGYLFGRPKKKRLEK